MSDSKITTWKANSQCLEIGVWIEPWERSAHYRREFTVIPNSYSSRWSWLDGWKDSKRESLVRSVELVEILDRLVQDHETLGLFCIKYGIGTEKNERI